MVYLSAEVFQYLHYDVNHHAPTQIAINVMQIVRDDFILECTLEYRLYIIIIYIKWKCDAYELTWTWIRTCGVVKLGNCSTLNLPFYESLPFLLVTNFSRVTPWEMRHAFLRCAFHGFNCIPKTSSCNPNYVRRGRPRRFADRFTLNVNKIYFYQRIRIVFAAASI